MRLVVRAGPEVAIAAFSLGHRPATDRAIGQHAVAAAQSAFVNIGRLAEGSVAGVAVGIPITVAIGAAVTISIAILRRLIAVVGGAVAVASHTARGFASGLGDGHRCALGQLEELIN